MSTIQVKPHPALDQAAWPLMIHPASGGLLDAAGKVPNDGRPWLYDGFTCRMLTDGAILPADDPAFAKPDPAPTLTKGDAPLKPVPAAAPAKADPAS